MIYWTIPVLCSILLSLFYGGSWFFDIVWCFLFQFLGQDWVSLGRWIEQLVFCIRYLFPLAFVDHIFFLGHIFVRHWKRRSMCRVHFLLLRVLFLCFHHRSHFLSIVICGIVCWFWILLFLVWLILFCHSRFCLLLFLCCYCCLLFWMIVFFDFFLVFNTG